MKRVQNPGTLGFYSWLFLVPKKNGKLCSVIDLSLLNQYVNKIDSQVGKTLDNGQQLGCLYRSDNGQQLGCLHRSDGCISSCSNTFTFQKIPLVPLRTSNISAHSLTLRNGPKSLDIHKNNGSNCSAPASTFHISLSCT